MARGEDTVCIASQQQDIGKIKNLILLNLEFRASEEIRCLFHLSHQWDSMSFPTHRVNVKPKAVFLHQDAEELKGCFGNILDQKESSTTHLSCDFKWIHFMWGGFFFPVRFLHQYLKKVKSNTKVCTPINFQTWQRKERGKNGRPGLVEWCKYIILFGKAYRWWYCGDRDLLLLPKWRQCQPWCNSLRPVTPNLMSLQWPTGREMKRELWFHILGHLKPTC